ncbi:U6 snRNA phosphodiesterase [Channa argus]|uniref:U6 snRNA phosphodiesterase 1 n=1 Tax=Channa argus TaxID=215402 RepID=A0A6G1PGQ1_CHAAH|nr:U6 snRNA phosphodiesterase [Channa argus]
MLVGYSSSSEDESETGVAAPATSKNKSCSRKCQKEDGSYSCCPVRKKPKTEEQVTKTRLPLPGCLLAMFPDEVDPETEDSSLHGGRIRSFKHERGNWATYVYLAFRIDDAFNHQINVTIHCQRGTDESVVFISKKLLNFELFMGMSGYGNASVLNQPGEVLHHGLWLDPSFHVSLAWCVGDQTAQMEECIQEMQCLVEEHEEGPFVLRLDCVELRCRTGNKTFGFPLKQ